MPDDDIWTFFGDEVTAFCDRFRDQVLRNEPDHLADLVAQALAAADGDNRLFDLGLHQRLGLLDAGEGGAIDAQAAEHAFAPYECAQVLVDNSRAERLVVHGGPGPHRHDFEEMFYLLEGEIEFTFRGKKQTVKQGMTVNIPANAPHFFTNPEGKRARMLCMCAAAGQEEFFMAIGKAVESRTTPAPKLSEDEQSEFVKKAEMLAPKYRTEMLKP